MWSAIRRTALCGVYVRPSSDVRGSPSHAGQVTTSFSDRSTACPTSSPGLSVMQPTVSPSYFGGGRTDSEPARQPFGVVRRVHLHVVVEVHVRVAVPRADLPRPPVERLVVVPAHIE